MDKWECVDDDDAVEKYWSTRKQMIAIYAKYMPETVSYTHLTLPTKA